MRLTPVRLVAAALTASLLTGCSAASSAPAHPPQPGPSAASPSWPTWPPRPQTSPRPTPSRANGDGGGNDAAPTGAIPRSARDGSTKDPAALPIPTTPRTTPNLGSADLIQPVETITAPPTSPVIKAGYSGAKVHLIQKKFGIDKTIQTLDGKTRDAVRDFQKEHDLEATGTVDETTWKAMFPDVPWDIDRYQVSPTLPTTASANARIEAMIAYIRAQIGAEYVWGAAGPKEYGFDCSGILLQALYHAGLDPEPLNVVDHQGDDYPLASKMYNFDGFKRVPVEQRQRGDFVFYGPPGRITHVVMFLGDGYVLEAIPLRGVGEHTFYESWQNHGKTYSMKKFAVRVTQ